MAEKTPRKYLVARDREVETDTVRIFGFPESDGIIVPKELLVAKAQKITQIIHGLLTEESDAGLVVPVEDLKTSDIRGVSSLLDRFLRTPDVSINISDDIDSMEIKGTIVRLHENIRPGSGLSVAQRLGVSLADIAPDDPRPYPGVYL